MGAPGTQVPAPLQRGVVQAREESALKLLSADVLAGLAAGPASSVRDVSVRMVWSL